MTRRIIPKHQTPTRGPLVHGSGTRTVGPEKTQTLRSTPPPKPKSQNQ